MRFALAFAVLVVVLVSLTVLRAQTSPTFNPSGCLWRDRPQSSSETLSRNDLVECVNGLIEAIQKNRVEIAELKGEVKHDHKIRGYLEADIQDLEITARDLLRRVALLSHQVEDLRVKVETIAPYRRGPQWPPKVP